MNFDKSGLILLEGLLHVLLHLLSCEQDLKIFLGNGSEPKFQLILRLGELVLSKAGVGENSVLYRYNENKKTKTGLVPVSSGDYYTHHPKGGTVPEIRRKYECLAEILSEIYEGYFLHINNKVYKNVSGTQLTLCCLLRLLLLGEEQSVRRILGAIKPHHQPFLASSNMLTPLLAMLLFSLLDKEFPVKWLPQEAVSLLSADQRKWLLDSNKKGVLATDRDDFHQFQQQLSQLLGKGDTNEEPAGDIL